MSQHTPKEQDKKAKVAGYTIGTILIIIYITIGLVVMFSSLLDDEFSQNGRYFIGALFILFGLYRGYRLITRY